MLRRRQQLRTTRGSKWRRPARHGYRITAVTLRRLTPLALVAVIGALAAAPALAHRSLTPAAERGMARALAGHGCPKGAGRVIHGAISTANPDWGTGFCGHFGGLLRRPNPHSQAWRLVVGIGDGLPSCSQFRRVPQPVLHDLQIGGLKSHGRQGIC